MITTSNPASLLPSALAYRESGLSVLPAKRLAKRPSLPGWKNFQLRIPQERQVVEWFSKPEDAICVVTGQVSGNLEMLDFDRGGDRFEAWKEQIPPELFVLQGQTLFYTALQAGKCQQIFQRGTGEIELDST